MKTIDTFFLKQKDPLRSHFMALHDLILRIAPDLEPKLKYGMPFFCYKGKMVCYLWQNKKTNCPYIGFADGKDIQHPSLIQEKRKRMKILPIDPEKDLPVSEISEILRVAVGVLHNK